MPTENERKWAIKIDCEKAVAEQATGKYEISQGYLIATRGITVRVRKSVKGKEKRYFFTMKANTGGRVVEIEQDIDERDFNDLWAIALNKLEKIRYTFKHGKNIWELDFFKDYLGQTYIAVAEVELPENQVEPASIPELVSKNIIFKVPLTDTRFSNKLLACERYAVNLLNEISIKEKS